MSTTHRSRSLVFGMATVFALMLLAPGAVTAEEVAVLAPVAAPSVDGTGAYAVQATTYAAAARQPVLALEADYLPAALASGMRAETAHLATIVLPD